MKDLSASIRRHSEKLRLRHPAVRDCHVGIQDRPPHAYERRRFNVRLDIALGCHEIVINREHEDDPAVALEDVFAAAHRQLDALDA